MINTQVILQLCAWLVASQAAEGRVERTDTDRQEERGDRSLADTFPFSLDLRNNVDLDRESKQVGAIGELSKPQPQLNSTLT